MFIAISVYLIPALQISGRQVFTQQSMDLFPLLKKAFLIAFNFRAILVLKINGFHIYPIAWYRRLFSSLLLNRIFVFKAGFLNLVSGADPDRCNRCKCIGESHMIDNLEVCAPDFFITHRSFQLSKCPGTVNPIIILIPYSKCVTRVSTKATKANA